MKIMPMDWHSSTGIPPQYGYMVEAGEKPVDTLTSVVEQIMALFK